MTPYLSPRGIFNFFSFLSPLSFSINRTAGPPLRWRLGLALHHAPSPVFVLSSNFFLGTCLFARDDHCARPHTLWSLLLWEESLGRFSLPPLPQLSFLFFPYTPTRPASPLAIHCKRAGGRVKTGAPAFTSSVFFSSPSPPLA